MTQLPTVFLLCKSKGRNNSAAVLERALLARDIPCYRVTPGAKPRYKATRVHTVINYGVTEYPEWYYALPRECKWYNRPEHVLHSSLKARTFQCLNENSVPTLEWSLDQEQAQQWANEGATIVCRKLTRAAQGRGIEVVWPEPKAVVPKAPMYTKMLRAKLLREYRVYVVDERAIDVTEKRRWSSDRLKEAGIDPNDEFARRIRTHANGWVFARNEVTADEAMLAAVKERAEQAAAAMSLGVGGVDIIATRNSKTKELSDVLVVETNTAIGLTGDTTTLNTVADALAADIRQRSNA